MVENLSTAVVASWVLFWFAIVCLWLPAAALGSARGRWNGMPDFGPALVWTWITIAVGVPAAAAVHGFNWATALLLSCAWPAALWVTRHRGSCRIAFVQHVRTLVFRIVAPEPSSRSFRPTARTGVLIGLPLLPILLYVFGRTEIRLPVPADFDTLARTRYLLGGAVAWDPLASMSAVLTRVSAADALSVAGAARMALVALAALAAGYLAAEITNRRAGFIAAPIVLLFAPWAPASTWVVLLLVCISVTSLVVWGRHRMAADAWHAGAALVLAAGQVVALPDPGVLLSVSRGAWYLEHPAAPHEALRLARLPADDMEWILVGPPEQQLEIGGRGQYYDLARFVSRFRDRAGDARFRFNLGADHLFVFVEKQAVDVSRPARGVGFVEAQPAAYRVPRERARLARLAKQLCDDYRRTHTGVEVVYDDAVLRVYRFDT